jgi:hypothetical protein
MFNNIQDYTFLFLNINRLIEENGTELYSKVLKDMLTAKRIFEIVANSTAINHIPNGDTIVSCVMSNLVYGFSKTVKIEIAANVVLMLIIDSLEKKGNYVYEHDVNRVLLQIDDRIKAMKFK